MFTFDTFLFWVNRRFSFFSFHLLKKQIGSYFSAAKYGRLFRKTRYNGLTNQILVSFFFYPKASLETSIVLSVINVGVFFSNVGRHASSLTCFVLFKNPTRVLFNFFTKHNFPGYKHCSVLNVQPIENTFNAAAFQNPCDTQNLRRSLSRTTVVFF